VISHTNEMTCNSSLGQCIQAAYNNTKAVFICVRVVVCV